MIQNGANVTATAIDGYHHNVNFDKTPLMIASLREIEEILIRNGAIINGKKGIVISYISTIHVNSENYKRTLPNFLLVT